MLGFDRATLGLLLQRHHARAPDVEILVDELVGCEVLTEHRSTFSRRDVLQAVAQRLRDGAPVERVEELADAVLERGSDHLVMLEPRRGQLAAVAAASRHERVHDRSGDDEARLTTRRLLLVEQGAVRSALARRDEHTAVVPEALVETVLAARGSLSDEQAAMVRRLTTDGDGVAGGGTSRHRQDLRPRPTADPHHRPPRPRSEAPPAPPYMLRSLGAPPDNGHDRSLWRESARTVESYRLHWDITDPDRPLGDEPHDLAQQAEHRWTASALDRNRRELSREPTPNRSYGLEFGLGR